MVETEEWKSIVGYEGIYEISSFGRIKTLPRDVDNGFRVRRLRERILKQVLHKSGYLTTTLMYNGVRYTRYIHVIVATHFIPNPEGLKEVNHVDGNKANPKSSNLEWSNRSRNMLHAYAIGLQLPMKGRNNPAYGKDYSKFRKKKQLHNG